MITNIHGKEESKILVVVELKKLQTKSFIKTVSELF